MSLAILYLSGTPFVRQWNHSARKEQARKLKTHSKLDQAREMFRLTSAEKRVAVFVLAAFLVGVVTKCYRDAHAYPVSPLPKATTSSRARP